MCLFWCWPRVMFALGGLADARAEVRRALEVQPNFTIDALTIVGFDADQREALAAALREAGMPE